MWRVPFIWIFVAIIVLPIDVFGQGAGIVGGVIGGAIGRQVGKAVAPGKVDVDAALVRAVETVSKLAPQMVDAETRLDGATVEPGRVFSYNYTMTVSKRSDIDMKYFNNVFAADLRTKVCANKALHPMFKLQVPLAYSYRGADGKPIGRVVVTPKECGF